MSRLIIALALIGLGVAHAQDDAESAPANVDAAVTTEAGSEEAVGTPGEKSDWVDGRFETGIDADWSDRDSDVDLHQSLSIRLQPPNTPRLQIRGALWMTEDLDGDEAGGSLLYDIDNASSADVRARLLTLYLQADDVLGGAQLRLGRQRILDGPLYNRIDGLYLKWYRPVWDAYLYGGARASIYEDAHDDLALGAGVGYRPFASTRLGIDFFYGDEHRNDDIRRGPWAWLLDLRYPRQVASEVDGQIVALSLHQRFGQNHWLHAKFLVEDGDADEFQLDLSGYFPKLDLSYHLNYRQQLERVTDQTSAFSGYYRVLGSQEEYQHLHLSVQRPITETWAVALEGDWHASEADDAYSANRDYWRLATVFSGTKIGPGLDLSMALEWWEVDGGEGAWVVTGEIGREWENFEIAFGADYEQYRNEFVEYNPLPLWIRQAGTIFVPGIFAGFTPGVHLLDTTRVETREEIYSAYLRGRWQFAESQALRARVTYEQDDGPDAPYWRVQAAYELQF